MTRARRRQAGLSLLEVCVVISVAGALLAAFIPAFLHEVRTSKIAEAGEALGTLHHGAAAYYAAAHHTPEGSRIYCLPDVVGFWFVTPSVDAHVVDFAADATPGAPTWRALAFAPTRPLRYAYTFTPTASGCGVAPHEDHATVVVLTAEGDLDGDGERSHFERRDGIDAHGDLVPIDVLYVRDRVE